MLPSLLVLQEQLHNTPLSMLTPHRIASLVEQACVPIDCIQLAMKWSGKKESVIVVSPPCCGQGFMAEICRAIISGNETLSIEPVPSIESPAGRLPSSPVVKTWLCHDDIMNKKGSRAKVVALLRNPRDLQETWFKFLRIMTIKAIASSQSLRESDVAILFDEQFDIDAFAQVSPSVVRLPGARKGSWTVESELHQWVFSAAKRPQEVKILFFEEWLANPEKTLGKLADFLGCQLAPSLRATILSTFSGKGLLSIANGDGLEPWLTKFQKRMIVFRFAVEEGEQDSKPDLQQAIAEARGVSPLGVPVASDSHGGFSVDSMKILEQRWSPTRSRKCNSYEALYVALLGCRYPSTGNSQRKLSLTNLLSPRSRAGSSSSSKGSGFVWSPRSRGSSKSSMKSNMVEYADSEEE